MTLLMILLIAGFVALMIVLLSVYFTTEDGAEDAAAFRVLDVAEWTLRMTLPAPQVQVATSGGDSGPSL
jgi:hypothetical protein